MKRSENCAEFVPQAIHQNKLLLNMKQKSGVERNNCNNTNRKDMNMKFLCRNSVKRMSCSLIAAIAVVNFDIHWVQFLYMRYMTNSAKYDTLKTMQLIDYFNILRLNW